MKALNILATPRSDQLICKVEGYFSYLAALNELDRFSLASQLLFPCVSIFVDIRRVAKSSFSIMADQRPSTSRDSGVEKVPSSVQTSPSLNANPVSVLRSVVKIRV